MPKKFEIAIPLPPEELMKRIEAARKRMAPAIGPCTYRKALSIFTCRIDYFNACALLHASGEPNSNETKVLVEIQDRKVGKISVGLVTALSCLLSQLPLCAIIYMGPHRNWLFITSLIVIPAGLMLLSIPFSEHVLSKFVYNLLLDDTQA